MCWYKQVSVIKEGQGGQYTKNALKRCLVLEMEEIMWESDYAVINRGYRNIFFVSLKYLLSFTFHAAGGKTFQSTFICWQWIDFVTAHCFTKQVSKAHSPNREFCILYSEFTSLLSNVSSKKHIMFALTSSLTRNLFLQIYSYFDILLFSNKVKHQETDF